MLRAVQPATWARQTCRWPLGRLCSSQSGDVPGALPPELKPRPEAQYHAAYRQAEYGRIYDKQPRKFTLQKGKQYYWCTCGWSHNQPFCDGTHKNPHYRITLKPLRIVPEETRDYWLCNCKQSKRRPFCDGTHRSEEVQTATRVYKSNF